MSPDAMCSAGMAICMDEIDLRDGWPPDLAVLAALVEDRMLAEHGVQCVVRVTASQGSLAVVVRPVPEATRVEVSLATSPTVATRGGNPVVLAKIHGALDGRVEEGGV